MCPVGEGSTQAVPVATGNETEMDGGAPGTRSLPQKSQFHPNRSSEPRNARRSLAVCRSPVRHRWCTAPSAASDRQVMRFARECCFGQEPQLLLQPGVQCRQYRHGAFLAHVRTMRSSSFLRVADLRQLASRAALP